MKTIFTCFALLMSTVLSAQIGFQKLTIPPELPVRVMAEWEEVQQVIVAFDEGAGILYPFLTEVVRQAGEVCEVMVVCENETTVRNYLEGHGVDLTNITFFVAGLNSVWTRDYAPTTAYLNDVDSLVFVDWIYNRHDRQADDTLSYSLGAFLNVPVFTTTAAPDKLVNVGGNFICDGMGTGFSSKLVLTDNNGSFLPEIDHDEEEIDAIMDSFMGIDRYIKFDILPYDVIHHLDMHMKLLDEETILFSEFPDGVSDAAQIEANIAYLLNNYKTPFGTDYKIVHIPVPPCDETNYPPDCSAPNEYRNYANAFFINKTVLVPTYDDEEWDSLALNTWRDNMPGYHIVGINSTDIIRYAGAVHCVIKEVGVREPLRIVHQKIKSAEVDSQVVIRAIIQHNTGIAHATVFYKEKNQPVFQSVAMTNDGDIPDEWSAIIPAFGDSTSVDYYIEAAAHSGKTITRPMTAPEGFWSYQVFPSIGITPVSAFAKIDNIFPNPASAITCVTVHSKRSIDCKLVIYNTMGQAVLTLFEGRLHAGDNRLFFDASSLTPAVYLVQLKTSQGTLTERVVVE